MSLVYAKCRFLPDIFFSRAALVGSYFSHKLCTYLFSFRDADHPLLSVQVKPQYDTINNMLCMYFVFQSKFWHSSLICDSSLNLFNSKMEHPILKFED